MGEGGWTGRRAGAGLLGGVVLLACVLSRPTTVRAADEEETDWPTTITRLKQQVYARPGHAKTRQQLAIAYNNYGVALSDQGEWSRAMSQFREALRLDETNQQFQENFGNVYLHQAHEAYEQHRITDAVTALESAIELNPSLAQAYRLLGKIQYDRQKLKEAQAAWERALELDPTLADVEKQLSQVTEELPVESKFGRLTQAFFLLRYEEHLERATGFDVRDALLRARRLVGSDFAYWPTYKIVVLIYGEESFRRLREESPEWLAGQFDGKIRVPLPGAVFDQNRVKGILFHEYTHAVVHDQAKGKCPTWLNEGLAEYEGRTQWAPPLRRLAKAYEADQLIPWEELSDRFSFSLSGEEVSLAYEQSYSIVAYLVQRYGFWRMRRLLKAVADDRPIDEALEKEFRTTLSRLEANWRDWLPKSFGAAP